VPQPGFCGGLPLIHFEILGELRHVETIATGSGIRELARLQRLHGRDNWRKRKGEATIRLASGAIYEAELHRYEAHGIGTKEFKIKRFLD
jgi:hypothetical protein